MILGLDFYDTVTYRPKVYKKLTRAVLNGGGEVHIITAIPIAGEPDMRMDLKHTHVPHTDVHIVDGSWHEIPTLKLRKCQELGIDMFIDDRQDTVELLNKHHILAVRSIV